ncbi:MAG: hypothetical protein ACRCV5_06190 [Afipia sp.]
MKLKSAMATTIMSNPHYTPGPWKLERFNAKNRNSGDDGWYVISEAGDHADVGEVFLFPPHPDDVQRCRANAALVAAAPELLEALLVLLRDAQTVCADVAQELELAPAIYQANRAIEKALKLPRAQTANAGVTGLPPAQTVELPPKPAGGRSELT